MSVTWISCPKCREQVMLTRLGKLDVDEADVGTRVHTKDSDLVRCDLCDTTFRTTSPTMWEAFGRDWKFKDLF